MNNTDYKSLNRPIKNSLPLTKTAKSYLEENTSSLAITKQYTPSESEYIYLETQLKDPIGDEAHTVTKGLVHRYPNKVLLKITDTCSAYCRFCFRKDMIGKNVGILSDIEFKDVIKYIQKKTSITEIILSGGDPLTLSNRRLKIILDNLSALKHIQIIRFHTRTPLIKPERIDSEFIEILNNIDKNIIIVLHINHADEINDVFIKTLKKFEKTSICLKSQSVLLKGINDNKCDLLKLFQKLILHNIQPYYLHHMDKALGTKHFHVPIKEGIKLMKAIEKILPTNLIPQYTLDIPNGHGKIDLLSNKICYKNNNLYEVIDTNNIKHQYYDEGL